MTSDGRWDPTTIERRLSDADREAMRRAGPPRPMCTADYLRFLAGFPPPDPAVLRRRRFRGGEPFRL